MRFVLFMKPNITEDEWGPGAEGVEDIAAEMGKFNQSLVDAGVLLAGDGLHPPSEGALVTFTGGKPTVTDGPYAEAKEVVGGYWLIQAKSREEAIEWAKRVPGDDFAIEVRRVYELDEWSEEVQAAHGDVIGR